MSFLIKGLHLHPHLFERLLSFDGFGPECLHQNSQQTIHQHAICTPSEWLLLRLLLVVICLHGGKKKKKHVGSSCDDKKDLDYCFPGRPDLFWSHLARPAVLTVTSLQESSYPVWYCALFFFNSRHYHEYWLWQNQFPLFPLQGASVAHSFLRIPTLRVPTQNTAGMEKRSRKLKKAGVGWGVVGGVGVLLWCGDQSACCQFLWTHRPRTRRQMHVRPEESPSRACGGKFHSGPWCNHKITATSRVFCSFRESRSVFCPVGGNHLLVFRFLLSLGFLTSPLVSRVNKPLNQTDQAKACCQLICRYIFLDTGHCFFFYCLWFFFCTFDCLLDYF